MRNDASCLPSNLFSVNQPEGLVSLIFSAVYLKSISSRHTPPPTTLYRHPFITQDSSLNLLSLTLSSSTILEYQQTRIVSS